MATSEQNKDTEQVIVDHIKKVLNNTSENPEDTELANFLKLVNRLGKKKMDAEEVSTLFSGCTETTLMKEHMTKQIVRSLVAISQDTKLWKAVWKDINRLFGPFNFSNNADVGEIDEATMMKYNKLLQDGTESVRHIRLMVVGTFGVGKTTIIRRLCNQPTKDIESTVGIDVSVNACEVDDQKQWTVRDLKTMPKTNFKHRIRSAYKSNHKGKGAKEEKHEVEHVVQESKPEEKLAVETLKDKEAKEEVEENRLETQNDDMNNNNDSNSKKENAHERPKSENGHGINTNTENIKLENKEIIEDVKEALDDDEEYELEKRLTTVSIWDFAGQSIYYSTHHFFLNARAIYLLVLDVRIKLSDRVPEDKLYGKACNRAASMPKGSTCLDAFKFWMNSIYTYTAAEKNQQNNYKPTIVLVGTFKDEIKRNFPEKSTHDDWLEEYIEDYFNEALVPFCNTEVIKLVHPTKFFVSKDDPDEIFYVLKKELTSIAENQPFWNQTVPMSWMPLERAIELRKDETIGTENETHDVKSAMMELNELEKIDKTTEFPLSDKSQFKLFLNFQHALGNVLYYDTEQLEDNIILNPQWILDVFKLFVTHVKKKHPTQLEKWIYLENYAVLSQELIDELLKQSGKDSFQIYKEKIVRYMEYLDVIAKPVTYDKPFDKDEKEKTISPNSTPKDYYIVPCLLPQKPPEEKLLKRKANSTPILCLVFENNFLPAFVCHRLMATCIRTWEAFSFNKEELMLFNGMGRFYLNNVRTSWLDLRWKDHIIYLQIFLCSNTRKPVDGKTCVKVRKNIQNMIDRIFSIHLGSTGNMEGTQKKQYDEYIKCIECNDKNGDSAEPGCTSLADKIKVDLFKDSEDVNCQNFHTISRDEALSCWYFKYKGFGTQHLKKQLYNWLQENSADSKVTERHVTELSEIIGKNYIALGIELEFTLVEIERIEMDEPNCRIRIKKILMEWRERYCDGQPTIAILESAFKKVFDSFFKDEDRHKEVEKWYGKKKNPSDSPTDQELIEVSHLVGRKYTELANMLFSREVHDEIKEIEDKYSFYIDRTLIILLRWKREDENVTFTFLKDCLKHTLPMDYYDKKKMQRMRQKQKGPGEKNYN